MFQIQSKMMFFSPSLSWAYSFRCGSQRGFDHCSEFGENSHKMIFDDDDYDNTLDDDDNTLDDDGSDGDEW